MLWAKTTFVVASLPAWLFVRGLSRVAPRGGAACIACSPLCGILLSDTLNHMPCVPPLSYNGLIVRITFASRTCVLGLHTKLQKFRFNHPR